MFYNHFWPSILYSNLKTNKHMSIIPFNNVRMPGRPKTTRIRSKTEKITKTTYCSKCKKAGHNKRSCKELIIFGRN